MSQEGRRCVRSPVDQETEHALVRRLRAGEAEAFDEVYAAFNARLLTFLVRLSRRRDVAEDLLEETWLPGGLFKGLTAAAIREHRGALYNLFETRFGTRTVRAAEKLKAVPADGAFGALLRVAAGHPLLHVERLSFTYGNRPVEWRRSFYKTDRHYYRSELG